VPDAAWKAAERRVCGLFGGRRRGPDGIGQSDCVSTPEAIQVKRSKRGVPEGRWIEAAKRHGRNEHKDWVLVVIAPGQHAENAIAVVSVGYLLRCRASTIDSEEP
jgi:hypothetical protein